MRKGARMFTTTIIDVAIGLILTYLVLSLVCVSITEAIGSALRLRARVLFSEINRLLDDTDLRETFWETPIIRSVSRDGRLRDGKVVGRKAPSYIHARTFVSGLFAAAELAEKNRNLPEPHPVTTFRDLANSAGEDTIFGGVLAQVAGDADARADTVRAYVEDWFDTTMERTAGVFKRWMQLISFLIALAIAVVLNADTIRIAGALWSDEVLRSQLVSVAEQTVQSEGEAPGSVNDMIDLIRPLPLGWSGDPLLRQDDTTATTGMLAGAGTVLVTPYKLIGLVITAFALSLGAPFWFDLLSRFVSIRGTGPGRDDDKKR